MWWSVEDRRGGVVLGWRNSKASTCCACACGSCRASSAFEIGAHLRTHPTPSSSAENPSTSTTTSPSCGWHHELPSPQSAPHPHRCILVRRRNSFRQAHGRQETRSQSAPHRGNLQQLQPAVFWRRLVRGRRRALRASVCAQEIRAFAESNRAQCGAEGRSHSRG